MGGKHWQAILATKVNSAQPQEGLTPQLIAFGKTKLHSFPTRVKNLIRRSLNSAPPNKPHHQNQFVDFFCRLGRAFLIILHIQGDYVTGSLPPSQTRKKQVVYLARSHVHWLYIMMPRSPFFAPFALLRTKWEQNDCLSQYKGHLFSTLWLRPRVPLPIPAPCSPTTWFPIFKTTQFEAKKLSFQYDSWLFKCSF